MLDFNSNFSRLLAGLSHRSHAKADLSCVVPSPAAFPVQNSRTFWVNPQASR
jgi:hypothetical protein